MDTKTAIVLIAFMLSIFSSLTFADTQCEMPPGIDEGDTYWILFKGESKMYKYKIRDIDDCWVQIDKPGGDHYWYQIDNIMVMSSKNLGD